jgi:hypothetical protein
MGVVTVVCPFCPSILLDVTEFRVSADGVRIVFLGDTDVDGKLELSSVSVDGSGLVNLNGSMGATWSR